MPVFERLVTVGADLLELHDTILITAHLRKIYPGERTQIPQDTFLWGVDYDQYLKAKFPIARLPLMLAKDFLMHREEVPNTPFTLPDRLIAVIASQKVIPMARLGKIQRSFANFNF